MNFDVSPNSYNLKTSVLVMLVSGYMDSIDSQEHRCHLTV